MKTRAFLTCIFLATGLLLTTPQAFAQAQGGGGMRRGGMGVLTQEQRTTIRETMQDEIGPIRQKLVAAQKEVVTAVLNNESDDTIKAKVDAVNKIEADMAMLRVKAVKKIISTLTDEQKTQLENARDGGYMALFGGFGGFGRGGGPGGRRGGRSGANQ
jgi:Spy/CpxP family protein refolding chaperone